MAARAVVVAVVSDGADRVHVVTRCGFGEVYGTAVGRQARSRTVPPVKWMRRRAVADRQLG
jgi:hypothetical protein